MKYTQTMPSFYKYLPVELKRTLLAQAFEIYLEQEEREPLPQSLQVKLKTFIRFSLQTIQAEQYNHDQNHQLLNCAWDAQTALWALVPL